MTNADKDDNSVSRTQKKVKFEFDPENYNAEIEEEAEFVEDEENDLDLDTIKASKNKTKGIKEFDSEGSEDEAEAEEDEREELDFDSSETEQDEQEEDDGEIPLEPFNLKKDREEGTFDSDGFYTRKLDEEADQDRWLANLTRSDIFKARQAHEQREKAKKLSLSKTDGRDARSLYEELAELLKDEDDKLTLQQIISSLKPATTTIQRAPLNKNRLKKLRQQGDSNPQKPAPTTFAPELKVKLERITEIVDGLMDLGQFGVYEETRRDILRRIQ